jgi:hypothetical protein
MIPPVFLLLNIQIILKLNDSIYLEVSSFLKKALSVRFRVVDFYLNGSFYNHSGNNNQQKKKSEQCKFIFCISTLDFYYYSVFHYYFIPQKSENSIIEAYRLENK